MSENDISKDKIIKAQEIFGFRRILNLREQFQKALQPLAENVLGSDRFMQQALRDLNSFQKRAFVRLVVYKLTIDRFGILPDEKPYPVRDNLGNEYMVDPIYLRKIGILQAVAIEDIKTYFDMLPKASEQVRIAANTDPNFEFPSNLVK